ncbi:catechol O-methyltransferase 1 [Penicillium malachiteum]|uniref:catechol O-methyltransferase n=1 Tax=Penicillium malachiteum TaxID=1324776 RepID=A0AAD6MRU1_9EURO|nr:catechol O-methyltransferase 1 [Penicillium malachiteum]
MTKDESQFYKPEEEIFHNDGREERLLEFIRAHPDYNDMQGSPEKILAAIDQYGRTTDFLMNVGKEKGKIVAEDLIPRFKPDLMVELGGYVGYSALLFGAALKRSGGRKYLSLEASSKFAAISSSLIELAGLDDIVEIRIGPCRESLRKLRQSHSTGVVDVFFIDHAKVEYVNDLKLCEELMLVGPGTTVIADNVISPGAPDYLEYVRSPTSEKIAKFQREKLSPLSDKTKDTSFGDPYLVYETTLIDSFEPTGEPDSLEVSSCLRIEAH